MNRRFSDHFHRNAYPINTNRTLWNLGRLIVPAGTIAFNTIAGVVIRVPTNSNNTYITNIGCAPTNLQAVFGQQEDLLDWGLYLNNDPTNVLYNATGPFDGINGNISPIVPIYLNAGSLVSAFAFNNTSFDLASEWSINIRWFCEV